MPFFEKTLPVFVFLIVLIFIFSGCIGGGEEPECSEDADCDDHDDNTIDECINPGKSNAYCKNKEMPECGNNICEVEESKETCCLDCGCLPGHICEDNECVEEQEDLCGNGVVDAGETSVNCCVDVGCPSGYTCENNDCVLVETCSDGTQPRQCSTTKPKYCSNGVLIDNCNTCGCPGDLVCDNNNECVNVGDDGISLNFVSLDKGEDSDFENPQKFVMRNSQLYGEFCEGLYSCSSNVYFRDETVIAVVMGAKPSSLYGIEIVSIIDYGDKVTVYVERTSPFNCGTIDVMTYPFHVVKTRKIPYEQDVTFEYEDKIKQCW